MPSRLKTQEYQPEWCPSLYVEKHFLSAFSNDKR